MLENLLPSSKILRGAPSASKFLDVKLDFMYEEKVSTALKQGMLVFVDGVNYVIKNVLLRLHYCGSHSLKKYCFKFYGLKNIYFSIKY